MEKKVCILTMFTSEKDKRTFKAARLLTENGKHVIVLGPKRVELQDKEKNIEYVSIA